MDETEKEEEQAQIQEPQVQTPQRSGILSGLSRVFGRHSSGQAPKSPVESPAQIANQVVTPPHLREREQARLGKGVYQKAGEQFGAMQQEAAQETELPDISMQEFKKGSSGSLTGPTIHRPTFGARGPETKSPFTQMAEADNLPSKILESPNVVTEQRKQVSLQRRVEAMRAEPGAEEDFLPQQVTAASFPSTPSTGNENVRPSFGEFKRSGYTGAIREQRETQHEQEKRLREKIGAAQAALTEQDRAETTPAAIPTQTPESPLARETTPAAAEIPNATQENPLDINEPKQPQGEKPDIVSMPAISAPAAPPAPTPNARAAD